MVCVSILAPVWPPTLNGRLHIVDLFVPYNVSDTKIQQCEFGEKVAIDPIVWVMSQVKCIAFIVVTLALLVRLIPHQAIRLSVALWA